MTKPALSDRERWLSLDRLEREFVRLEKESFGATLRQFARKHMRGIRDAKFQIATGQKLRGGLER